MKPQVVAPGYDVRSAVENSDSTYERWVGTSMAAPHVSGLVALMWDAAPCLIGNYTDTETILEETATPIIYDDGSPATPTNYPNYATGWGEINAFDAVKAAVDFCNLMIVADPIEQDLCLPTAADDEVEYVLTKSYFWNTSSPITLSTQGHPVGSDTDFSVNPFNPPVTSTLTISNLNTVTPDNYVIEVLGFSPTETHTTTVGLNISSQLPTQVNLTAPMNDALEQEQRPMFEWEPSAQAQIYWIEIATDEDFGNVVISKTLTQNSYTPDTDLQTNTIYYWRVRAENACIGTFSHVWRFTTAPAPGECAIGTVQNLLFTEDFETGGPGWSNSGVVTDTWELTNAQAYSGTFSYYATDVDVISDQQLTSPMISLPTDRVDALTLLYWNSYLIEKGPIDVCYDGSLLEISTDGGSTWTQLQDDVLQTTPYAGEISDNWDNPLENRNAWCGDSEGWIESIVDISAYAGQSVQLRYRLGTDVSNVGEDVDGWYLDDVRVQSCITPTYQFLPLVFK
jgi:hypothetical protein